MDCLRNNYALRTNMWRDADPLTTKTDRNKPPRSGTRSLCNFCAARPGGCWRFGVSLEQVFDNVGALAILYEKI